MAHSAPYIAIHITSYHVIRWATKKGEIHFKEEIVAWTIENPTVSRLSQELVDRENVHEGLMVGDVNAGFVLRKVIMALDLHLRSSFLEWRDFREKMHWFFPRTPIEPAHSRKWGSLTPSTCGVCVCGDAWSSGIRTHSTWTWANQKKTHPIQIPTIHYRFRFPIGGGKKTEKNCPSKPKPIRWYLL